MCKSTQIGRIRRAELSFSQRLYDFFQLFESEVNVNATVVGKEKFEGFNETQNFIEFYRKTFEINQSYPDSAIVGVFYKAVAVMRRMYHIRYNNKVTVDKMRKVEDKYASQHGIDVLYNVFSALKYAEAYITGDQVDQSLVRIFGSTREHYSTIFMSALWHDIIEDYLWERYNGNKYSIDNKITEYLYDCLVPQKKHKEIIEGIWWMTIREGQDYREYSRNIINHAPDHILFIKIFGDIVENAKSKIGNDHRSVIKEEVKNIDKIIAFFLKRGIMLCIPPNVSKVIKTENLPFFEMRKAIKQYILRYPQTNIEDLRKKILCALDNIEMEEKDVDVFRTLVINKVNKALEYTDSIGGA
ncbi:MAG: hypothetical protein ACK5MG_07755 [Bacteroidales bacterium]